MVFDSFDTVFYTAIFLVPGFLMKGIIDNVVPAKKVSDGIHFLHCLTYSVINCAIWAWLYVLISPFLHHLHDENATLYWIMLLLIVIIGGCIVAILIAVMKKRGLLQKLLQRITGNSIHSVPTAWDYKFSKQEIAWVIVRLKSGSVVYGYYGEKSLTSSDSDLHDISIEKIYKIDADGIWHENNKSKGALISAEAIESIEFLGGANNGTE
jgi:hypothetical protein